MKRNRMLNQVLYDALRQAVSLGYLPGNRVDVLHDGQPARVTVTASPFTESGKRIKVDGGEEYGVCCPACGDRRYRLSINHRYGTQVDVDGKMEPIFWTVHCYNEECQTNPGFYSKLRKILDPVYRRTEIPLFAATELQAQQADQPLQEVKLPEQCVSLSQLPGDHPAHVFLKARFQDPVRSSESLGLMWCPDDPHPFTRHRLVFPLIQHSKVVGWQARHVNAEGGGSGWEDRYLCRACAADWIKPRPRPKSCPNCLNEHVMPFPKYYTAFSTKKSQALYNHDTAAAWPFVVLVEGPMDVLRLGSPEDPHGPGPGVAVFGHSVSGAQKRLIAANPSWKSGATVLLFDADVWKDKDATKAAQMEWLYRELYGMTRKGCVKVVLDGMNDPGDTPHGDLWIAIKRAACEQKIDLGI